MNTVIRNEYENLGNIRKIFYPRTAFNLKGARTLWYEDNISNSLYRSHLYKNRLVNLVRCLLSNGINIFFGLMRIILFVLILLVYIPSQSYSAPCYGTKMPESKGIFAGFQTHNIFKRYLYNENGKLRSLQHFFLFSYGVNDRFTLDFKGGAGYIKQHPVGSDEVDYSSGFDGGYGFRLKLYDKSPYRMVFGFQHISVHPKKITLLGQKNKAVLDDWQFSLLASYDLSKLTPYLGTRWSRVDYIHWIGEDRKRKKSDLTKSVGLIAGMDIPINEKMWFNLEGQVFDSEALSFSVNFKF